jgi:phospholipid/cholesterol/gamma-HCH transport system substrate-binding protein
MRDPGLRDQLRTEILVGALLFFAFIGLIMGILWISGAQPGTPRFKLFAKAPEAGAIGEGTRITLLGVDVGSVKTVELRPDGVVLELEITHRGTLPIDTQAKEQTAGIMGMAALALLPGESTVALNEGDTIYAAGGGPGLQDLVGDLGGEASEVLAQIRKLLNDSTVANAQAGIGSFAGGMEELETLLERESQSIEKLIQGLSATSARLAEITSGPELDRTMAHLDSLTARLAEASSDLDQTSESLASILSKIDSGEGSLGRMVNDSSLYVSLTATLQNMEAASEEIALLTRDIRERPEHYTAGLKFSVF